MRLLLTFIVLISCSKKGDDTTPDTCTVTRTDVGAMVSCPDGSGAVIFDGEAGESGKDGQTVVGPKGERGEAGASCTTTQLANGLRVSCPDGTDAVVFHGADAQPSAYSIVEIIEPCPDLPGTHREVLLRLSGGGLLAHYSDGAKQFLTWVTPGTYQLTDGSGCIFTVDSDLQVTW